MPVNIARVGPNDYHCRCQQPIAAPEYDILPRPWIKELAPFPFYSFTSSRRPVKSLRVLFPSTFDFGEETANDGKENPAVLGEERSRIASLSTSADITENNALVSTPRRCSYHNIIHTGMMYSLALWTDAGPSGVEIGAERAWSGLVRDLVSEFAWHAHDFTSVLLRRPARLSSSYFDQLGESHLGPSDLREDAREWIKRGMNR